MGFGGSYLEVAFITAVYLPLTDHEGLRRSYKEIGFTARAVGGNGRIQEWGNMI